MTLALADRSIGRSFGNALGIGAGRAGRWSQVTPVGVKSSIQIERIASRSVRSPAWQEAVSQRLARLRTYEAGWDGPESRSISEDILARAGRLLEVAFEGIANPAPPAVVPCANGSLQLEWWLVDTRLEVYFEIDGSTAVWAQNRVTGEEIEVEGTPALNTLMHWASRLTADKFTPAT